MNKLTTDNQVNNEIIEKIFNSEINFPELYISEIKEINELVSEIDKNLFNSVIDFFNKCIFKITRTENDFWFAYFQNTEIHYNKFKNYKTNDNSNEFKNNVISDFIIFLETQLSNYQKEIINLNSEVLKNEISLFLIQNENYIENLPKKIKLTYPENYLKISENDDLTQKISKTEKAVKSKLNIQNNNLEIVLLPFYNEFLINNLNQILNSLLSNLGKFSFELLSEIKKYINEIENVFENNQNNLIFDKNKFQSSTDEFIEKHFFTFKTQFFTSIKNNISEFAKSIENNSSIIQNNQIDKNLALQNSHFFSVWQNNQINFLNSILFEQKKKIVGNQLKKKIIRLTEYFEKSLKELFDLNFKTSITSIENFTKNEELKLDCNYETGVHIFNIFNDLDDIIIETTENLPDEFEIVLPAEFSKNEYKHEKVYKIYLKTILKNSLLDEYINRFQKSLSLIANENDAIFQRITENFNSLNSDFENITNEVKGRENIRNFKNEILKNSLDLVNFEKINFEKQITDVNNLIFSYLTSVLEDINLEKAIKLSEEIDENKNIPEKKIKKRIYSKLFILRNLTIKFLTKIVYGKSKGILLRDEINSEKQFKNIVEQLLDFRESVVPDKNIIEKLPSFYTNLFKDSPTFQESFFVGRNTELQKTEKALNRFKQGVCGAILITGEPCSGKTELTKFIAGKYFEKPNIFTIKPKSGGSIKVDDFIDSVQDAVGIRQDFTNISKIIKPFSAFIINDLELWWSKSENGFAVLDEIQKLVINYGSTHLFIINCDNNFYNYINEIYRIENNFISIIDCSPFDAEQLKNIILTRHKSSGITFKLRNKKEEKISELQIAKMFNSIFNFSKGNVGIALNYWLKSISEYKNETVELKFTPKPDLQILENIDNESIIFLFQFILHKQLTVNKVLKISNLDKNFIELKFKELENCGIIVNKNKIYSINYYLKPFIYNFLKSKNLI